MQLSLLNGGAALQHLKEITNIQPSFLFYCAHELLSLPYNIEIEVCLHQSLDYCVDNMSPEALLLLLNIYPHIRLTHDALKRLQHYIYQTPALLSLTVLFQLMNNESLTAEDERYIRHTLLSVGRDASNYRCEQCGFSSKRFYWLCPSCKQWEEMRPHFIGVS
jgi:lipopolysaccharide biosynthesis regulator YciM